MEVSNLPWWMHNSTLQDLPPLLAKRVKSSHRTCLYSAWSALHHPCSTITPSSSISQVKTNHLCTCRHQPTSLVAKTNSCHSSWANPQPNQASWCSLPLRLTSNSINTSSPNSSINTLNNMNSRTLLVDTKIDTLYSSLSKLYLYISICNEFEFISYKQWT